MPWPWPLPRSPMLLKHRPTGIREVYGFKKESNYSSTKFQLISCLFTFLSVVNQCLYLGQKKKFLMAISWTYEFGKNYFFFSNKKQRRENIMQIGITEQTIMAIMIFSSFFTLLNIWFWNATKIFLHNVEKLSFWFHNFYGGKNVNPLEKSLPF